MQIYFNPPLLHTESQNSKPCHFETSRLSGHFERCRLQPGRITGCSGCGTQQIEIAEGLLATLRDLQRIYKASVAEIAQVHGIGQQTAVRLKAALALAIRLHEPTGERPLINSPSDAAALVQYEMSLLEVEHLRVLLLDTRNRVLDIVEVYSGSVNSSQVRVAEVFRPAVCTQRLSGKVSLG